MAFALLTSRYFKRKGFILAAIGGSLALALIVLVSTPVVERVRTAMEKEEEASFSSRMVAWGGVMDMIGDYPLLGTGPGTFPTIFTQYQPPGLSRHFTKAHNDYLHFTSEVGLPLIAIFAWMVIAFYKRGFYKLRYPSRLVRGTTLGAMSGITAILFHSISDFNLHIPANAILFTILAAIVVSPIPTHNGLKT
jgi:O-antigen ligase